jgi:hypothetical protein
MAQKKKAKLRTPSRMSEHSKTFQYNHNFNRVFQLLLQEIAESQQDQKYGDQFTCLTPDNFTRQWGSSAA